MRSSSGIPLSMSWRALEWVGERFPLSGVLRRFELAGDRAGKGVESIVLSRIGASVELKVEDSRVGDGDRYGGAQGRVGECASHKVGLHHSVEDLAREQGQRLIFPHGENV